MTSSMNMCVGTRNTTSTDSKGSYLQSRKQQTENDHWNYTRWRKLEIVCYRTSPKFLTFACFTLRIINNQALWL